MNEPWINVSARVDTRTGVPNGPIIATDRLGFRSVIGGAKQATSSLPIPTGVAEPYSVVLVEDSDDDAMLFNLAVQKSGRKVFAQRASNGAEARQLLAGRRPALIVLDCHLPGESGLDLLREIRSLQSFRHVPIVMMSGSGCDSDVEAAYATGVNSFLRKPSCYTEYMAAVKLLIEYWLEINCTAATMTGPSCVWVG